MRLPILNEIDKGRDMISRFGGYNHNLSINPDEFFDEQNMTSDYYPALSPRKRRGNIATYDQNTIVSGFGIFGDNFYMVADNQFVFNNAIVNNFELAQREPTDPPRQFVHMGAYILIFPDKMFYNTADGTRGSLDAHYTSAGNVTYTLCKSDGTPYDQYLVSDTMPQVIEEGSFWIYEPPSWITPGDVNNDGVVDEDDVQAIQDHMLGNEELTGDAFLAADLDGNGKINTRDLGLVHRILLGTYVPQRLYVYKGGKWNYLTLDVIRRNVTPGDVNGDGFINQDDIAAIQAHMNEEITLTGNAFLAADLNGDGFINSSDIGFMQNMMLSNEDYYWCNTTDNTLYTFDVNHWRQVPCVFAHTAPVVIKDGFYWLDTSSKPHVMKQYMNGVWNPIPTVYTKIDLGDSQEKVNDLFSVYDGIEISGSDVEDFNGSHIIQGIGDNYIILIGTIDEEKTQATALVIDRNVPDMDYYTESGNRVWGCSSIENEIYACKLGDPKNWNFFMGISTDSYAVSVGSPKAFTGACTHLGYVMFFKEDMIHKIYGTKPANFQMTSLSIQGVEQGSAKSLRAINTSLYYKSKNGICVIRLDYPELVSQAFGNESYKNAVAGVLGLKYYVCMESPSDEHILFVLDTERGIWHKETTKRILDFAGSSNNLYFFNDDNTIASVNGSLYPMPSFVVPYGPGDVNGDGVVDQADIDAMQNHILTDKKLTGNAFLAGDLNGDRKINSLDIGLVQKIILDRDIPEIPPPANIQYQGAYFEEPVEWSTETGDIGMYLPDNKYVSKLQLRLEIDDTAMVCVAVKYNNHGDWIEKARIERMNKCSVVVPIIPMRCDTMRIKLYGVGGCKIYSITKTIESGTEL